MNHYSCTSIHQPSHTDSTQSHACSRQWLVIMSPHCLLLGPYYSLIASAGEKNPHVPPRLVSVCYYSESAVPIRFSHSVPGALFCLLCTRINTGREARVRLSEADWWDILCVAKVGNKIILVGNQYAACSRTTIAANQYNITRKRGEARDRKLIFCCCHKDEVLQLL